ncbi:unnamed protein product [Rhizoctonia solani]|uniref:Uncharacterized protein n=1 Tax=Rhizoctonia solani TaxID=456999 RepID=A0A8H3AIT9_9AGAM|nr:unnamed protein product [Rhizoctonia solani]
MCRQITEGTQHRGCGHYVLHWVSAIYGAKLAKKISSGIFNRAFQIAKTRDATRAPNIPIAAKHTTLVQWNMVPIFRSMLLPHTTPTFHLTQISFQNHCHELRAMRTVQDVFCFRRKTSPTILNG